MHPIAKSNFGNVVGALAVRFHNGTEVVDGFVIKQMGTKKFLIGGFAGAGDDGAGAAVQMVCVLRQIAGAPAAGECTMSATPFGGSATNVKSLSMAKLLLVGDSVVTYKRGVAATKAGQATVAVLAAVVTTANDA